MGDLIGSIISRLLTMALAPRPVISRRSNFLVVRSGWRTALFTLGGRYRKVIVDPMSQIVRIKDRYFWLIIKTRVITFDRVHEVVYAYTDMLSSDWFSHDAQDLFKVGLWLQDSKQIILFRFYGQGEFVNNSIWPDWMMWDEILPGQIVQHNMDSDALAVAELLSTMIGVQLGNGPMNG
jgi:hypothetical protein